MVRLLDWDVVDRVFNFALIVASGVTILSGSAWTLSLRLPRNPAVRHLVLASALAGCLAVPVLAMAFLASGWSLISVPLVPAGQAHNVGVVRATTPIPVGIRPAAVTPGRPVEALLPEPDPERAGPVPVAMPDRELRPMRAATPGPRYAVNDARHRAERGGHLATYRLVATALIVAWACGSAILLLGLARSACEVRRLRRSSSLLGDDSLGSLLDEVCRKLGVRRSPPVVVSCVASAPFAAGFARPIIVLPAHVVGGVSREEMRDVLVHEIAHVLRSDHVTVFFQELARALYWPVVPVHSLARALTRAREELCDNYVLVQRTALSYGETLLHLAQLTLDARAPRASVGILHRSGELERRIGGLLDRRRNPMTKNSRSLTCLVTLLFLSAGSLVSATRFVAAGDEPVSPTQAASATAKDGPAAQGVNASGAPPASPPPLRVRGKVLDENTGKPIHDFTLIGGRGPEFLGGPPSWYWVGSFKRLTGGLYDERGFFPEYDRGQTHALRVEAEGYRPGVLLDIADDAGEVVHDFRLIRGGPTGIVLTPDGKPAAGAGVRLSSQSAYGLTIVNGQFDERETRYDRSTTGPQGGFFFEYSPRPRNMTVLHESGFAVRLLNAGSTAPEITLEPWGRVEGVIRMGKNPGSGLEVGASEETQTIYSTGPGKRTIHVPPRQHFFSRTKADAEGRFVLEHVQPGPGVVHRVVPKPETGYIQSHLVHVDVPAGGTVHVTIGGGGRPVVGRFTSRDGTSPTLAFGSTTALFSSRAPLPRPPDYATYSPERKREWTDTFQASAAGKALERQKQQYALVIAADGTFRADDVPPGRYSMTLNVHETIKEAGRITIQSRLTFQRVVNVPEPEADQGDEPFAVGDVVLTPKGLSGPPGW